MVLQGVNMTAYTPVPSTSKSTKRKRYKKDKYITTVSNRFAALTDNDSDSENDNASENDNTSDTDITEETTQHGKTKSQLPPPIVVYTYLQNHMESIKKIKEQLKDEISIKYRGNRIIMQTKIKEDYVTLKKIIQDAQFDFHTYTPRDEQEHKLVIKNLPPSISTDEVFESLQEQNIQVKKVTQFFKKQEDNSRRPLPLYLVTVPNQTKIKDILNIKKVCFCVVSWERYKSKNGITQCFKCQQFDHIAKNCFKKTKCLKCAGTHLIKDCDQTDENIKCVNCNEKHLANSKNCTAYIRHYNNKQSKNVSSAIIHHKNKSGSFKTRQEDFPKLRTRHGDPEVAQPTQTPWPNTGSNKESGQSNSFSDIISLIKSLFNNIDIQKIICTIKNIACKIAQAPDNISKIGILMEAVIALLD